jgi:uridine kinase
VDLIADLPAYFAVLFLMAALYCLKTERRLAAGAAFGVAMAAQPMLVVLAPLFALYFLGRPRLRAVAPAPLALAVLFGGGLSLALRLIPAYRTMSLPLQTLGVSIPFGSGLVVYLAVLAAAAIYAAAWAVRRLDFGLLWAFCGLTCVALLLLNPLSPALALSALPFLAIPVAKAGRGTRALYWVFAITVAGLQATHAYGHTSIASLLLTTALGLGAVVMLQIWRQGIAASPFHKALRETFAIGVTGDSGTGKDTLVQSITGMVGLASATHLSGDNYHNWDRHEPMWGVLTHLNPQANDLTAFASDVAHLIDRRGIHARRYDHSTGRKTGPSPLKPAQFVLASGLHALWSPALTRRYDLRIYLDMEEQLRRRLKIRRDTTQRGHDLVDVLETIERRAPDADRYIRPQAETADVIFRLEARHRALLDSEALSEALPLRLIASVRPGESLTAVARLLAGLCGMQVIERMGETGWTEVMIDGDLTAEDIRAAARRLAPAMTEILDLEPQWEGGMLGVMQLIVLDRIEGVRRRRSLAA